jgi:murein DD-endopeptidase MepM/ murein hydrolase activator NlpD
LSSILLLSQNLFATDYKWSKGTNFLSFLEKNKIPLKTYFSMDEEDKELIQEIRANQSYSIIRKKNKISEIQIPISDELMLKISNTKKGYQTTFIPIPFETVDQTISFSIKKNLKNDLYQASKKLFSVKQLEHIYAKSLPFSKMKKGDKVIIIYSQNFRNGKAFTRPEIEASMVEVNKKVFYAFLMNDGNYYDSLGKKYKCDYHCKFINPVPNFKRISSNFTQRRFHPILKRYKAHLGTDYAAQAGKRIVASGAGKIVSKGWQNGYGRTIVIQHGNGVRTLYGHMKGYAKGIFVGKKVAQGTTIGYVGSSGRSTGPHLHFGLYQNGKPTNPSRYIKKQVASTVKLKGKPYQKLQTLVKRFRPTFQKAKKYDYGIKQASNKNYQQKKES